MVGIFAPANGRKELPRRENKITFNKARKIAAIKAAEPPQNAKEVNSFLCTVQYDARFMEKYAQQTNILRVLLKAKVFALREEHQQTFESLKEALSLDLVLVYFNPSTGQEVHVEGCPLGISATLVQCGLKDDNWWVVQICEQGPVRNRTELFTD